MNETTYFTVYTRYAGEGYWDVVEVWHFADKAPTVNIERGFDQWFHAEIRKQEIAGYNSGRGYKMAGEI